MTSESRLQQTLDQPLREALGAVGSLELLGPVGGGDINRAFKARMGDQTLFIKVNQAGSLPMFKAESDSLRALAEACPLRIPHPHCHGANEELAWLVLEYVDLKGAGDEQRLGSGLAELHRQAGSAFGWPENNFIGSTPQANTWHDCWAEFWWQERMRPQLELGGLSEQYGLLEEIVRNLLQDHAPQPSLLHGDLWSGNHAFDASGTPLLFDPACYYGDRETDLAMTELFGGFSPRFHASYRQAWPLGRGYEKRRPLYQLYHVLNHLNLFGPAWRPRADLLINKLSEENK